MSSANEAAVGLFLDGKNRVLPKIYDYIAYALDQRERRRLLSLVATDKAARQAVYTGFWQNRRADG